MVSHACRRRCLTPPPCLEILNYILLAIIIFYLRELDKKMDYC